MDRTPVRLVVVDGNIGAGKSTLLEGVRAAGYAVLPEPVARWREPRGSLGGRSALSAYYDDPRAHALAFQLHAARTRLDQLAELGGRGGLVVAERDPFDASIFPEHDRRAGRVSAWEHEALEGILGAARRAVPAEVAGAVYLRLSPESCLRRVRERGRGEEAGVGLERLRALHLLHEEKHARGAGLAVDAGAAPGEVLAEVLGYLRGAAAQ